MRFRPSALGGREQTRPGRQHDPAQQQRSYRAHGYFFTGS
jgi:hypothetical protein